MKLSIENDSSNSKYTVELDEGATVDEVVENLTVLLIGSGYQPNSVYQAYECERQRMEGTYNIEKP